MPRSVNKVIKYVFDYREFVPSEDLRTLTENFINLETPVSDVGVEKHPVAPMLCTICRCCPAFPFLKLKVVQPTLPLWGVLVEVDIAGSSLPAPPGAT